MPVILAILIFFLMNPFDWWMNDIVYMCIVVATLILFVLFALFSGRRNPATSARWRMQASPGASRSCLADASSVSELSCRAFHTLSIRGFSSRCL